MVRLIFFAIVLAVSTGCPNRWQSLSQIDRAAPVLNAFYDQHPGVYLMGIDASPSVNAPERYRLKFTDPMTGTMYSVVASADGRLATPAKAYSSLQVVDE